jgi:ABC-type branched-subunit amino acid transport system substrate-binding protein
MAGCTQASKNTDKTAPKTIKIGGILSFTGPDSNIGTQVQAGYEFAIEDINKTGGVYVKEFNKKIPLEINILDMESSAEKAIARAETLYSQDKVVAYAGTTFIGAASGVAEKNKVPTLLVASATQGTHERGYKYWFSVTDKTPDIAKAAFGRPSGPFTGPAYATIQILADAITRAGTLDREKVRDAIAAADMMTVQGPVKFRDNGTNITPHFASCQWQNGKNELIRPLEKAKARLVYPVPPWSKR